MIMILAIIVTVLGSWLVIEWRSVMERSARWRLYALRDDLRRYAIENPGVRTRQAFVRLDNSLSGLCGSLRYVSLWTLIMIPFLGHDPRAVDWLKSDLMRPENACLLPFYEKSVVIMSRYLIWRHCVAIVLLTPTILGGILMCVGIQKLTKKAVSGGIDTFERSGLIAST